MSPQLAAILGQLSNNQLTMIESIAHALAVPVGITVDASSDLVDDTFAETAANVLTLHHALHEEPLNKKAFEYLFKNCLLAMGDAGATLNPAPGDESWDVRGLGQRWSLKTEAAAGISRTTIKVEKLMEARWVREVDSPEKCAAAIQAKLPPHLRDYDRIVVLRAFRIAEGYEYQLVEVPKDLLVSQFSTSKPQQFAKEGRALSFGANYVDANGERQFRILLDSSVEKVRLWYQSRAATVHATWTVRVRRAQDAQQNAMTS